MKNSEKHQKFRVAILGHRGIPNAYGGFETLAEELASCLVGLGCSVVVYCRKNYFKERPEVYKGASLIYLPTITKKSADTFFHTFISVWHAFIKNTADTLIIVNVGNAPSALLAKILGKKVILCVDGLDWQRKKWGKVAKTYLRICSYFAGIASHEVVTDAASVQEFYKKERKLSSTHIPYGTEIETVNHQPDVDVLKEYGLDYKKYFTYVARFEPENNPILVVKAHAASGSKFPLVMIGDNRYNHQFVEKIKKAAGKNVIFTGYLFGSRYKQLVRNSLASVRAAEVGGLSPVVIEAMGRASCIIANDKPENREPLGDTGLFFNLNINELAAHFKSLTENPELGIELGKKSAQRAMLLYSWDKIGFEYLKLIRKVSPEQVVLQSPLIGEAVPYKKKILITGAGGTLGRDLYRYFSDHHNILATTAHPTESWQTRLDVTDPIETERIVGLYKPDYIFHLAALTNLEECEKNLPNAYSVNTLAVKHLAQISGRVGAKLIFVSSGNIFNGEKTLYTENDEPSPLNVYGLTKHMGELMAQYYAPDHLIIRLGWLIGGGPRFEKKFIGRIVEQVVSGNNISAVVDKFGTISHTYDVARTLEILLGKNAKGTYHVVSPGIVSRFELAQAVVSILGYSKYIKVTPVSADYFAHVYSTLRPKYECLLASRLNEEKIDSITPWLEALERYLHDEYAYAFNLLKEDQSDILPDAAALV